jgi:protein-tyrosine phosphatase
MIKILFICHGNICRSPMAEFIFKDMVARRGIAEQFHISSAATSQEEIGNPVYPPAVRELARHGISAAGKRAVQLRVADYGKYDLLLAMEQYNRTNMMKILKEDPEGKVRLLLDFTDQPGDIADPWYYGRFDQTYADICRGCEGLLTTLGF